MELSKIIALVGVGAAFTGGLAYLLTAAVVRVGRSIDVALDDLLGDDDE